MGIIDHMILRNIIFFLSIICLSLGVYSQQGSIRHLVQPMETFYSISKKYQVPIEEIKKANPGTNAPRAGEYLNIPSPADQPDSEDRPNCDKLKKSRNHIYQVALMIPLYLEQTMDSAWAESIDAVVAGEVSAFRFIQFYEGFMLAADSMRRQGMNLKISVYDVDHQAYKLRKALADPQLGEMDLIVGPFLKNSFTEVADFARMHQIPIVNPLSARQDILKDNPFVFKVTPSAESQPESLSKLVKRDFPDHNVILYIANKYQNTELIARIREAIEGSLDEGTPPVRVVDYASDSIRGFLDFASMTIPNLIVVYAENEALPAALLSKLNAVKSDYPVTVIGMPEWDTFNNLESGYMLNLNGHIFQSSYINFEDENVKGFYRRYRADYLDEPQEYAVAGFTSAYYFLQALYQYGSDFTDCLDDLKFPMMQNQFRFQKTEGGGYDNLYWNIMQYYDYRLVDRSVSWK